MTHFAVLKKGIYIQDVAGPFDSMERAIDWADSWAASDIDSHHDYVVVEMSKTGICTWGEWYIDEGPEVLYETRKPLDMEP